MTESPVPDCKPGWPVVHNLSAMLAAEPDMPD
jgi:hypothetical protein